MTTQQEIDRHADKINNGAIKMEIGWIDFSEEARKRTLDILSALQEPTAVDELGIGIIRDAFSDEFFPATSTLFTKARYLFLVPYALRDMEREDNTQKSALQLQKNYDDREKQLAIKLLQVHSDDTRGIIGARSLRKDFTGPWVKRGPAIIYWGAIRKLGLCKNPDIGLNEYFRIIAGKKVLGRQKASFEEAEKGWNDDESALLSLWHLPDKPYVQWQKNTSMTLLHEEADFLKQQLALKYPNSLYSLIMQDQKLYQIAISSFTENPKEDSGVFTAGDAFLKFVHTASHYLDKELTDLLVHAVAFSNFVYACLVRYNAQLFSTAQEAELEWEQISSQAPLYAEALDVDWIYQRLNIFNHAGSRLLYTFLISAREYMKNNDIVGLDACIRSHECTKKQGLAKIGRQEGIPEGWRGGRRLSYRFEIATSFAREVWESGETDA